MNLTEIHLEKTHAITVRHPQFRRFEADATVAEGNQSLLQRQRHGVSGRGNATGVGP